MGATEAATSQRDVLPATKLFVPGPPPGFVARPRLLHQLDQRLDRGLVVVCAAAGFGKTALLADWARHTRHPVAWLSLDPADNDPTRFWRHTLAALDRVRQGLAARAGPLLGPSQPVSLEGLVTGLVTGLVNQLVAAGQQLVLVLDDYHLIETQAIHATVGLLLEHRPPGVGVVLASRADPPLGLARWRARGQLGEVRVADLRFTPAEAAALLRAAVGSEVPEAAVARLAARTEGWAAGLQLAGLSLRGQRDLRQRVAGFSGGPPVRAGLSDRVGPGPPTRAGAPVPARDLRAGTAVGWLV